MNAVILAGGFGSRLKPLTDTVPKPMLPIANAPMLDYAVAHLRAFGIADTVLTLGYKAEQIRRWMGGYRGVRARYTVEDVPLGTAGGVRAACAYLDDTFLVISGDALENVDYAAMLQSHRQSGKLVTMAVTSVPDPRAFGLVSYAPDGTVTAFAEKPEDAEGSGVVNCGVYIVNRRVLDRIPRAVRYDFSRDLFPALVAEGELNAFYHDGYWSDLGTPRAYYEANLAMLRGGFYPQVYNRHRTVSHRIGSDRPTLAAYSALVTGKTWASVVGEDAAVPSDAQLDACVVLPRVTVHGRHFREIIGEGYVVPIASPSEISQDSTQIYKNFS